MFVGVRNIFVFHSKSDITYHKDSRDKLWRREEKYRVMGQNYKMLFSGLMMHLTSDLTSSGPPFVGARNNFAFHKNIKILLPKARNGHFIYFLEIFLVFPKFWGYRAKK